MGLLGNTLEISWILSKEPHRCQRRVITKYYWFFSSSSSSGSSMDSYTGSFTGLVWWLCTDSSDQSLLKFTVIFPWIWWDARSVAAWDRLLLHSKKQSFNFKGLHTPSRDFICMTGWMVSEKCKDKLLPFSEDFPTKAELENFPVLRNKTLICWKRFIFFFFLRDLSAVLNQLGNVSHEAWDFRRGWRKKGEDEMGKTINLTLLDQTKDPVFCQWLELDAHRKTLRTEYVYDACLCITPHCKVTGRERICACLSQPVAQW